MQFKEIELAKDDLRKDLRRVQVAAMRAQDVAKATAAAAAAAAE